MSTVLLGVFGDYEAAARVREVLVRDGFPTDRVDVTASRDPGWAGLQPADSPHIKFVQYFRALFGREDERDYPEMLAQRIDNGAATVTVLPRGAIETERATQILRHARPTEVLGHDLEDHGWERAAARHESAWARYVWIEHSPDDPDCIYCRLFPEHAPSAQPAYGTLQASSAGGPSVEMYLDGSAPSRTAQALDVGIRRVRLFESLEWLRKGWDDLWHIGSPSLVHGVLIATLGAVLLILGSTHPYFVAAALSGYLLIGPIMATGVCELSRRRAAGEPLGFDESLRGVARHSRELLKFGAILAAATLVWFVASESMLRSVLHSPGPATAAVLRSGFTDTASRAEIIAYVGSGAVLAVLVFAVSVVAVPLIIDRRATATEAMLASLKAAVRNIPAMLVWSALIVASTTLGFVTFLVGMVFITPLLGHATWHAYRSLVE